MCMTSVHRLLATLCLLLLFRNCCIVSRAQASRRLRGRAEAKGTSHGLGARRAQTISGEGQGGVWAYGGEGGKNKMRRADFETKIICFSPRSPRAELCRV